MKIKTYTINLSEQMAVCDANYIRLLKLLGNTRSQNNRVFALPSLGHEKSKERITVSLEVLEEFKYTSTICIRQRRLLGKDPGDHENATGEAAGNANFTDLKTKKNTDKNKKKGKTSSIQYNSPEMIIRVYHDAKTAEVTSYQHHQYFKTVYSDPNPYMYQCDEKEQLNLFLAEWLNLCINEGLSNPEELKLEKLVC